MVEYMDPSRRGTVPLKITNIKFNLPFSLQLVLSAVLPLFALFCNTFTYLFLSWLKHATEDFFLSFSLYIIYCVMYGLCRKGSTKKNLKKKTKKILVNSGKRYINCKVFFSFFFFFCPFIFLFFPSLVNYRDSNKKNQVRTSETHSDSAILLESPAPNSICVLRVPAGGGGKKINK